MPIVGRIVAAFLSKIFSPLFTAGRTLLIGLAGWAVKEIFSLLVAAGLFGLTYLGLNAFLGRFIDGVRIVEGVAGDAMQVLGLFGIPAAVNIILSCAVFGLTLRFTPKFKVEP